jgi:hypothetical protein
VSEHARQLASRTAPATTAHHGPRIRPHERRLRRTVRDGNHPAVRAAHGGDRGRAHGRRLAGAGRGARCASWAASCRPSSA